MTVEEGIKMVVSGGIVTPPDKRPITDQERIPATEVADLGDHRREPRRSGAGG
jgi:uncharacterized membrane protein